MAETIEFISISAGISAAAAVVLLLRVPGATVGSSASPSRPQLEADSGFAIETGLVSNVADNGHILHSTAADGMITVVIFDLPRSACFYISIC
jgi:hypothetical protein